MTERSYISLKVKLASALLQLGHIKHEASKSMTADQVIAHFQWDHYPILKAHGGPDAHWNLTPRLIADHAYKTNVDNGTGRSDKTAIARERRIERKRRGDAKPHKKIAQRANHQWPSRPFQKAPEGYRHFSRTGQPVSRSK